MYHFSWNFSFAPVLAIKHSRKQRSHSHTFHFLFIWFSASIFYRIKHRVVVVLRFKIWEYERQCLFSIDKEQNSQTMHIEHRLLKICLFSFYFTVYSLRCEMWERPLTEYRDSAWFNFSRILFFSAVFVRTFLLLSFSSLFLIQR